MQKLANGFEGFETLITGATSGIGKELAKSLAEQGARICGFGLSPEKASDLAKTLGSGHQIGTWDLLRPVDTLPPLIEPGRKFDGVVFSAGVSRVFPIVTLDPGEIDELLRINLTSVILTMKHLITGNHLAQSASIVFVSSIAADRPQAGQAIYSITKEGLSRFMKVLVMENARRRWRFNLVTPGMVKTAMLARANQLMGEERVAEVERNYPRGFAEARDVVQAIEFLLVPATAYINGAEIHVDGGARHFER